MSELASGPTPEVTVDRVWLLKQAVVLSCSRCLEPLYFWRGSAECLIGLEKEKKAHVVRPEDEGCFSAAVGDGQSPMYVRGYELSCMVTPGCNGFADLSPLIDLRNYVDGSGVESTAE